MGDDKPVENDQPVWDEKKHQRYSLEEVGKHVDRTDCWVIIHDLVYNITKFLDEVSPPLIYVSWGFPNFLRHRSPLPIFIVIFYFFFK